MEAAVAVRHQMWSHLGLLDPDLLTPTEFSALSSWDLIAHDQQIFDQVTSRATAGAGDVRDDMAAGAFLPVVRTAPPRPSVAFEPQAEPEVSIITVSYGSGRVLLSMLQTLHAHLDATSVEVIVVDQPHPHRGRRTGISLQLTTAGVRLIRPVRNVGFGGGCELGVLAARGRYIAFVNPDIVFTTGWLAPLREALDASPPFSIIGAVLLDIDGSIQEVGQRLDGDGLSLPRRDQPAGSAPIRVDYASAACWLVRRHDHITLGGFDPIYFPAYYEDVDLALRAEAAGGGSWVAPQAQVVHLNGGGTPEGPGSSTVQRQHLLARWPRLNQRQRFG